MYNVPTIIITEAHHFANYYFHYLLMRSCNVHVIWNLYKKVYLKFTTRM